MSAIRKRIKRVGEGKALMVMFLCFSLVFTICLPVTWASTKSRTKMKHSPPDYFVPAYRIQLDITVSDPAGINLVRCYFKAAGEADFVFVPMTSTGGSDRGMRFSGILPAPSSATKQIEYLFLAVNNKNNVVKSQSFKLKRKKKDEPPAWQDIPKEGDIRVSMELDKVPTELRGFSDNIVMDQVESGLRFGVVAGGLYYLSRDSGAHTSGAAASAKSAGTVTATTVGYSTAALIGSGVAAAAIAGGTAVAVSGGGGGGGGDSHSEALTEQTIVGTWDVTGTSTEGSTLSGTIIFYSNQTYSYNWTQYFSGSSTPTPGSGSGTWTLSGTYLTMNFDGGAVYEGQASGNSKNFTLVATNNPWTLNFKR